MSSFFSLSAISISLMNRRNTQLMANRKYSPIHRVGSISAVPTHPRLVTRNVTTKVFAGYGGSQGKPEDGETWEKRVRLSLEKKLGLLKEYIAVSQSCDNVIYEMVDKERDVEEHEKWFKFLFEEFIGAVQLPILLGEASDDGRNTIKNLVSLLNDAAGAYRIFKEAEAAVEELRKVHPEALDYKARFKKTYNNELAEAYQYVFNESYYLIEWRLKSFRDI